MSETGQTAPLPYLTGEGTKPRKTTALFPAIVGLLLGISLAFVGLLFLLAAPFLSAGSAFPASVSIWALSVFCLLIGGYSIVRAVQGFLGWFSQRKDNTGGVTS